jgi:hypothetical protein
MDVKHTSLPVKFVIFKIGEYNQMPVKCEDEKLIFFFIRKMDYKTDFQNHCQATKQTIMT